MPMAEPNSSTTTAMRSSRRLSTGSSSCTGCWGTTSSGATTSSRSGRSARPGVISFHTSRGSTPTTLLTSSS